MNDPVRLQKVNDAQPCYNSLEALLQRHAILILTIAVIILFVLVGLLISVVFSGHFLSMTESNGYYYHMNQL